MPPKKPNQKSSAVIGHERKAKKKVFLFVCEWLGCDFTSTSMNHLNDHVAAHRRGYTSILGKDNELKGGEYALFCHWLDCGAQIRGEVEDFNRHVFYHTFHQYLKHVGEHVIEVEKVKRCRLGTDSRNVIPELPEKLQCRWGNCDEVHDNPYLFYAHVVFHTDDLPPGNDPKGPIKCRWEACTAVTKSRYKMKEHIRSHTQAKVVACPTCGALFSSNTKFLDHIKRQHLEVYGEHECTHCHRAFPSERLLRDHSRRHVHHYKCPMCDMTCSNPSGLREHILYRHSDQKEFPCPQCDYTAKSQKDIDRHMEQTHNKEADGEFVCGFASCNRKYDSLKELFLHREEGHENPPRLFQCHICEKDFTRGTKLSFHLNDVHKFNWPSGHKRFRYKLHDDGYRRLQTVRYESIEVTEQILGRKLTGETLKDSSLPRDGHSLPGESATSVVTASSASGLRLHGSGSRESESNSQAATTKKNNEQMLPTDSAVHSDGVFGSSVSDCDLYKSSSGKDVSHSSKGEGKRGMAGNAITTKWERGEEGGSWSRKMEGKKNIGEKEEGISRIHINERVCKVEGDNVKKVSFEQGVEDVGETDSGVGRKGKREGKRKCEDSDSGEEEVCDDGKKHLRKNRKKGRKNKMQRIEEEGREGEREFKIVNEKVCVGEELACLELDKDDESTGASVGGSRSYSRPVSWGGVHQQWLSDDSSNSSTLYTLSHVQDEESLSQAAHDLDAALMGGGGGSNNDDSGGGVHGKDGGCELTELKPISLQSLKYPNDCNDNNSGSRDSRNSPICNGITQNRNNHNNDYNKHNAPLLSMPNFETKDEGVEEPASPTRYMLNFSLQTEHRVGGVVKCEDGGDEGEAMTGIEDVDEGGGDDNDDDDDEEGYDGGTQGEEEVDADNEDGTQDDEVDDDGEDDGTQDEEELDDDDDDDDEEEEEELERDLEETLLKNETRELATDCEDADELDQTGLITDIETEEDDNDDEMEKGGQSPTRYTLATPRDESSRSRSPTLYALPSPIDRSPQSPSRYQLNSPFGGSENAQSPTRYALNSPAPFDDKNAQSPTLYCLKSPRFSFPPQMASSPSLYTLQTPQEQFDENAQSPTQYNLLNSSLESNSRYAIQTPSHASARGTPGHCNNDSFKTVAASDDPSQSPTLYQLQSPFHSFSYSSHFHASKAADESPCSTTLADDVGECSKAARTSLNRISSMYNSSRGSPSSFPQNQHQHHQHRHGNFKSPSSASSPRVSHQTLLSPGATRIKSPLSFRSAFQQLIQAVDGIEGPMTSSPRNEEDSRELVNPSPPASTSTFVSSVIKEDVGAEESSGFEGSMLSSVAGVKEETLSQPPSSCKDFEYDAGGLVNVKHVVEDGVGYSGAAVCDGDPNIVIKRDTERVAVDEAGCIIDDITDKIIETEDGRVFLKIGGCLVPVEQQINLEVVTEEDGSGAVVKMEEDTQSVQVDDGVVKVKVKEEVIEDNASVLAMWELGASQKRDEVVTVKQERVYQDSSSQQQQVCGGGGANVVCVKKEEDISNSQRGELKHGSRNDLERNSSGMFLNIRSEPIDLNSSSSNEIKNESGDGMEWQDGNGSGGAMEGEGVKSEGMLISGDDLGSVEVKQEVEGGDGSVEPWQTYNLEMLGEVALKTHSENSRDQTS